jgi:hypothetical protein
MHQEKSGNPDLQPFVSPGDCHFEDDTCQWVLPGSTSDLTFFWNRTNANLIRQHGLQGPAFDHSGNKNCESIIF